MSIALHKHGQPRRAGLHYALRIADTPEQREALEAERANGGPEWTPYEPPPQHVLDDLFPNRPPPPAPPVQSTDGYIIKPGLPANAPYGSVQLPLRLRRPSAKAQAEALARVGCGVGGSRGRDGATADAEAWAERLKPACVCPKAPSRTGCLTFGSCCTGQGSNGPSPPGGGSGADGGSAAAADGDESSDDDFDAYPSKVYVALQGWTAHDAENPVLRFRPPGSGVYGVEAGLAAAAAAAGKKKAKGPEVGLTAPWEVREGEVVFVAEGSRYFLCLCVLFFARSTFMPFDHFL